MPSKPSPVLPRPPPAQINVNKTVASAKGASFPIRGYVEKGFEPVLRAFEGNFEKDYELGAGVTTYRGWNGLTGGREGAWHTAPAVQTD